MNFTLRDFMPEFLRSVLWGNRKKWGLKFDDKDPCWLEWQRTYSEFYSATQRSGIGIKINDAGYEIMSSLDIGGKRVLEIGAADIRHLKYMKGKPSEYILIDNLQEFLRPAEEKLSSEGIPFKSILVERNKPWPLADQSVDIIISFYSLEHLYPLRPYLEDMKRVLKPGGTLIGAIPAEGGLAWGGGAHAHISAVVQEKYPNRSG